MLFVYTFTDVVKSLVFPWKLVYKKNVKEGNIHNKFVKKHK